MQRVSTTWLETPYKWRVWLIITWATMKDEATLCAAAKRVALDPTIAVNFGGKNSRDSGNQSWYATWLGWMWWIFVFGHKNSRSNKLRRLRLNESKKECEVCGNAGIKSRFPHTTPLLHCGTKNVVMTDDYRGLWWTLASDMVVSWLTCKVGTQTFKSLCERYAWWYYVLGGKNVGHNIGTTGPTS